MSIFKDTIKKFSMRLSSVSKLLPDRNFLYKGTKTAALLGSLALAGKLCHVVYKKVGKKIDDSINESRTNAATEIKTRLNRKLEKFIFECVFRWVLYLLLILLAVTASTTFHLRKDLLVTFVILGIYSFYIIKSVRICCWYISFCRENGLMFNPARIIRAYLYKAILNKVQIEKAGLPLHYRLAMNFFGPTSDKFANEITTSSMQSTELRREAMTRVGMWVFGWIIYALIYEKLFLYCTGINFNAIWEPIIWPFHMLIKFLSVQ